MLYSAALASLSRRLPRKGLAAGALVATALVAAGCKPEPVPGSVDLVGDSITFQAMFVGGGLPEQPEDLQRAVDIGWQASDVLGWVQDQVADERPEALIVALGTNDAAPRNGGWTASDVATWDELLNAPHTDSCVVVILPALGDAAPQDHRDQVELARQGITSVAQTREGPTVIEDWGLVIAADPSVLAEDGVHMAKDADGPYGLSVEAAQARTSLYWQGLANCPPPAPAEPPEDGLEG
jgi:hypothetical protein